MLTKSSGQDQLFQRFRIKVLFLPCCPKDKHPVHLFHMPLSGDSDAWLIALNPAMMERNKLSPKHPGIGLVYTGQSAALVKAVRLYSAFSQGIDYTAALWEKRD